MSFAIHNFANCFLCNNNLVFFDRDTRKRDQTKYQIQMCCNLLAVYIVFLFGIEEVDDYGWCTFLAALLHYTLLTTWLWMGVYANKLYLVFSKVGLLLRQAVIRCFFTLIKSLVNCDKAQKLFQSMSSKNVCIDETVIYDQTYLFIVGSAFFKMSQSSKYFKRSPRIK